MHKHRPLKFAHSVQLPVSVRWTYTSQPACTDRGELSLCLQWLATADHAAAGAAQRRGERRLRAWLRQESLSVAMALAEATHHTAPQRQEAPLPAGTQHFTRRTTGACWEACWSWAGWRPVLLGEPRPQGIIKRRGGVGWESWSWTPLCRSWLATTFTRTRWACFRRRKRRRGGGGGQEEEGERATLAAARSRSRTRPVRGGPSGHRGSGLGSCCRSRWSCHRCRSCAASRPRGRGRGGHAERARRQP